MKKRISFLVLFFTVVTATLIAQSNIIDEVIWIVGDEAIFRSEVEEHRIRAQYEGITMEGDPYCVIPEQLAIQKLYLHQAELDSISASEGQVMSQVDRQLSFYISQIGSREKMEEYFGKSTSELREELRDIVRNQQIIELMQNNLIKDINATPADVRRFFSTLPDEDIPTVPAQVELQIMSIEPPITTEEENRVKEQLRDYAERVNSGSSTFSVLARMYSEDMGSSLKGGELGFMGRAELVPEYSAVAFSLQDPTKVSRIVETEFGYHIIQLIERRGDRVNTRHILLKPRVSLEDRNKTTQTVDSIASLIRSGKITFEQAVIENSKDKNTVMNAGLMLNNKAMQTQGISTSKFEYQDLPAEIAKVVYNMNVGEISKPFSMINSSNKEVISIIKVKSKIDTHKANLTDDYQMLKRYYEAQKKDEFLKEWVKKKQKETYISIDPAWRNCEFQYEGWIK